MIFSEQERLVFSPIERLLPSEWCEKYRYIAGPNTPEPGKWRNNRTPYLVGPMDSVVNPEVQEVIISKAAQIGYSELLINLTAYFATQSPGPLMLVAPNKIAGGEFLKERIYPAFYAQDDLAALLPSNKKKIKLDGVQLVTMPIYVGYSGSAQSVAGRSIRYMFMDEINKFEGSKVEANPIALATERTNNFGTKRKILLGCTPTDQLGNITVLSSSAKQYKYHCPCKYCGHLQPLDFEQVKWHLPAEMKSKEPIEQADWLLDHTQAVYYECASCSGHWTEGDRVRATIGGKWLDDSGSDIISGRRIAFHIPKLISQWNTLALHAAEFVKSKHSPDGLRNFNNSWRGLPHEEVSGGITTAKAEEYIPVQHQKRIIPDWCHYLISGADTQQGSYYYSTYAFGSSGRMALIDAGLCASTEELKANTIDCSMQYANGVTKRPAILMIDSGGIGSRTAEVYSFAATDVQRIFAIKGASTMQTPPVKKSSTGTGNFNFYTVDSNQFKDHFAFAIEQKQLTIYENVPPDWFSQITSEHKIAIHTSGRQSFRWTTKTKNAADHYKDCAIYALAGKFLCEMNYGPIPQIQTVEPPKPVVSQSKPQQQQFIGGIGKLR